MINIKYCKICLYPETKPDLKFNDAGVCSACIAYKQRVKIDWKKREKDFIKLARLYKSKSNYDCVIPVSGGKDSTYQVLKANEYGLKPLCVNSTTCDLTPLGRRNLDNIKKLGFDLIEYSPNLKVRKKLNAIGLKVVGDISWPEHIGMFTIPVTIAKKFNIKLIIWGENSQNEYGGPLEKINSKILDRRWLEEFGGLNGMRITDLITNYNFNKKDILPYFYLDKKLTKNIHGIFLGQFFKWEGELNAKMAKQNGFEYHHKLVEGSVVSYENLDNYQTGIHDHFKFLKYGFGRTTDLVSMQIRRGKISRNEGIKLVKKFDGFLPKTYLGKSTKKILSDINIDQKEFAKICDKFTNKYLFKKNNKNELIKNLKGHLIKDFEFD